MTRIIISFAVVLLCAGAGSGDQDYELIIIGNSETICVKSLRMCKTAQGAISLGLYKIALPDTVTHCLPHPGCFSSDSNTIKGFNRDLWN